MGIVWSYDRVVSRVPDEQGEEKLIGQFVGPSTQFVQGSGEFTWMTTSCSISPRCSPLLVSDGKQSLDPHQFTDSLSFGVEGAEIESVQGSSECASLSATCPFSDVFD